MSITIMVVDDSDFVRERMIQRLEMEGLKTVAACNGIEAVERYQQETVDAVFMDITMPKLDGIGALSEIRKIDPDANIIMLTAVNQSTMITKAIHLGAKDYLIKPVSTSTMLNTLTRVLGYLNAAH